MSDIIGSRGYVLCHHCGNPVSEEEKYIISEKSKFKLLIRGIIGGTDLIIPYWDLKCESCVRNDRINKIIK